MGVTCQILIDRTEDGVFKAGELVTGTLKYFIDKPTQYKIISMCFVGKGRCAWTEKKGRTTTNYSNNEEYTNQVVHVYLGTNKEDLISGGFEYPFQFLLPIDIPPSYKDNTCAIKYKITVTFVKANIMKSKKKFDVEIPVTSYVNPCSLEPMMFCLKKNIVSFKPSNKIEVKGEISKTCIAPGENLQMIITVNNDTNLEIDVKTELVSRLTYISSCNHKKIYEEFVQDTSTTTSIAKNSVANLISIVPTFQNLSSVQHSKVMTGEYKIKVTAKLPFPRVNAVLYIPVAIGLRKHELVVPAVYYQYDGEQPSCSTVSPHNNIFVRGDEEKDSIKHKKGDTRKIAEDESDEDDGINEDINDEIKLEKLDIKDSSHEQNNNKDRHHKESKSR